MEYLKHQLEQALMLHDKEQLSNRNILTADQQMLKAVNDQRLKTIEEYETLINWFIEKVDNRIEIPVQETGTKMQTDNLIDQEIRQIILQLPEKIQSDILRLNSGSKKQLRAKLVIKTENSQNYYLAAMIELFHLATLIQDDVIDQAKLRRHQQTINDKYSNRIAILVSDILLVAIIKIMKQEFQSRIDEHNNKKLAKYVEKRTNDLLDSLIASELNAKKIQTLDDYFEYAKNKTAKLFSFSMLLGALAKYENDTKIETLKYLDEQGIKIGLLFQKVDDYIDYSADISSSGKDSRDLENDIKNYMYFQLQTSSMEQIKTDLIEEINKYIGIMPEYSVELGIIKENIQ